VNELEGTDRRYGQPERRTSSGKLIEHGCTEDLDPCFSVRIHPTDFRATIRFISTQHNTRMVFVGSYKSREDIIQNTINPYHLKEVLKHESDEKKVAKPRIGKAQQTKRSLLQ